MNKIKDLSDMPDIEDLRRICRGIAALEIVMCRDKRFRYYFYNPNWSDNGEVFELINGCGSVKSGCNSYMLILFCPDGCVINGFDNQSYDSEIAWTCDEDGDMQFHVLPEVEEKNALKMAEIKQGVPEVFHDFMYGQAVESMKTTFCIWKTKDGEWSRSDKVGAQKDGSAEMLDILDKNPRKYIGFCNWYYNKNIPFDIAEKVYNGEPLTPEMVSALNSSLGSNIEEMESVKEELNQMKYPHTL